jgi:hypothetical protein
LVAVHNLSDRKARIDLRVDDIGKDAECEEVLSDGAGYPPLQAAQSLALRPWGYRWVRVHRPSRDVRMVTATTA